METIAFQSLVFSYTVYGGIIIGILYDLFKVLRGKKRHEGIITSIWDILFLTTVLLVAVWAIFSSNYGQLRAYVFIGFLVGFFLYEKILGKICAGVFYFTKRKVISFFKTTNSLFLLPFKFLYFLLWYPMAKLVKFIRTKKKNLNKIKKIPKILLEQNKKYYNLIIRRQNRKS